MKIGERIRTARLEAGLSQRELSEEIITRNMLSQIENGTALPSLPTLCALAKKLRKPVGYFFGEQTELPEEDFRGAIWKALEEQDPGKAHRLLKAVPEGRLFPLEREFLRILTLLRMAEQAARENRRPYAITLLHQVGGCESTFGELEHRRLLLLAGLEADSAVKLSGELPSLDEELLLRAQAALVKKDFLRAEKLLDAAENQTSPEWNLLRGRVWYAQTEYASALPCFQLAEKEFPRETARYLEVCFRELQDFKQAYYYACRQKEL